MKNLKISIQLMMLVGCLMAAFSIATFFQIQASANAIYHERYEMLRTQTETALSVLKRFHALETKGEITREEAQTRAYDVINDMRFVPDGYYFGYDYAGVRVIYPDKKGVGQSFAHLTDKAGNKFLMNIVDKGRTGGGWTEYLWPKPGQAEDQLFMKAAYSLGFEPWGITVGTGAYLDDLDATIMDSVMGALIADSSFWGWALPWPSSSSATSPGPSRPSIRHSRPWRRRTNRGQFPISTCATRSA